jgi:hypothetical protein
MCVSIPSQRIGEIAKRDLRILKRGFYKSTTRRRSKRPTFFFRIEEKKTV